MRHTLSPAVHPQAIQSLRAVYFCRKQRNQKPVRSLHAAAAASAAALTAQFFSSHALMCTQVRSFLSFFLFSLAHIPRPARSSRALCKFASLPQFLCALFQTVCNFEFNKKNIISVHFLKHFSQNLVVHKV